MLKGHTPKPAKFRKDYRPSDYLIDHVALEFDLYEDHSLVRARMQIRMNPAVTNASPHLQLDGEELQLQVLRVNGTDWPGSHCQRDDSSLTLLDVPAKFELETVVKIHPERNTRLEGLYQSGGKFCTQCEAQGFHRITYFLDRPDILARYDVTIRAPIARYPFLLANGNRTHYRELGDGRHEAQWSDPFPKPCYLFALVAGDFDLLTDKFVTHSGRTVALEIYVDRGKLEQCHYAMLSLKNAMAWDERVYGREYDLDVYMIVAVSDFNMGAMENKGLNIFNTKYVLAHPQTATDTDYEGVESVIAHEYFHNWSGNRVTCRDWFQLSLKEGLTVFRDQQFSSDMGSPTVNRMDDVRVIRTMQFSEDAGPMAHPVRPDSYVEMNNFYTVTVYNKGAEVVRMLHTMFGAAGYRKGMDLYFSRYDGQAVTCDDFVQAHADANGVDLTAFKYWYSQSGTPTVHVDSHYDESAKQFSLTLTQTCAKPEQHPFHFPFVIGLLDANGAEVAMQWTCGAQSGSGGVLPVNQVRQQFVFNNVNSRPLPSLLRDFSAPVKVEYDYSDADLAFLLEHDSNLFNRWDAAQTLGSRVLLQLAESYRQQQTLQLPSVYVQALRSVLKAEHLDNAVRARLLQLPDVSYVSEQVERIDIDALDIAQHFMRRDLALKLFDELLACYHANNGDERLDGAGMGRRALANMVLGLLVDSGREEAYELALQQAYAARNMTDLAAATRALTHSTATQRDDVLAMFAARFGHEALVMDKWLQMQASAPLPFVLDEILRLETHPCFDARNPNKVRALWMAFANANPIAFHRADGSGYAFIADRVMRLNDMNPQLAARLVASFNRWRKYDDNRQRLMAVQLKRILAHRGLSPDVYEIASRSSGVGEGEQ